jgi:hypothetical protein
MTVERLFPSGDYLITEIYQGHLFKVRYVGYTEREAKSTFRYDLRKHKKQTAELANKPKRKP